MTRKEFEKLRVEIESSKFKSVEVNPISFGIQRLLFEKEKLKQLIKAAESIPMKTTLAKAARYKRKLERANASLLRLQKTEADEKRQILSKTNIGKYAKFRVPTVPAAARAQSFGL